MNWTKLFVGAAGTSLLAWGAHAVGGDAYVDGLGEDGTAALAEADIEGVSVTMAKEPSLSRTAILSGEGLTDEQKAAAEQAVRGVNGVAEVRWAGDEDAAEAESGPDGAASTDGGANGEAVDDSASAEAVGSCQEQVDAVTAGKKINFRSGSAYMPESSLAIVDSVANALKACDGMTLAVGGHTDATGSAEVNQTISQARADAVSAALAERGIAAARITATGFGSTKPEAEGAGANAANRRIEFTLSSAATAGDSADGGE